MKLEKTNILMILFYVTPIGNLDFSLFAKSIEDVLFMAKSRVG